MFARLRDRNMKEKEKEIQVGVCPRADTSVQLPGRLDSITVSVFVDFLTLANTETALATPLERVQNL